MAAPSPDAAAPVRRDRLRRGYSFATTPRPVGRGYSRYVRGMKLLLPAAAAVIVSLVIAWPQLHWTGTMPGPEAFNVRPEDAESLRMLRVRYIGTDARDRPFTVTADSTDQSGPNARRLTLENPQADIALANGGWVAARAARGVYDREQKVLDLDGGVELFHDDGYQIRSTSARIDFDEAAAAGDRPVVAQGPAGVATGEGFRVLDGGRTIFFSGRASVELNRRAEGNSP